MSCIGALEKVPQIARVVPKLTKKGNVSLEVMADKYDFAVF
jgi:hypothetical protein